VYMCVEAETPEWKACHGTTKVYAQAHGRVQSCACEVKCNASHTYGSGGLCVGGCRGRMGCAGRPRRGAQSMRAAALV